MGVEKIKERLQELGGGVGGLAIRSGWNEEGLQGVVDFKGGSMCIMSGSEKFNC